MAQRILKIRQRVVFKKSLEEIGQNAAV
jgi:hypothetical protein